eukprot:TRINITY_DN8728_c0_g1_i1.p1 TRINITY_DN8728_c0_g1~~TRINITY_DN8728_c0_g1_i1.p1  ORF type:complete len:137 (-),score=18.76 TRINITY_DN8728_c0_g1_i1:341-751(-)
MLKHKKVILARLRNSSQALSKRVNGMKSKRTSVFDQLQEGPQTEPRGATLDSIVSVNSHLDVLEEIPELSGGPDGEFEEYFGNFKLSYSTNALFFEHDTQTWEPRFLYLFGSDLHVYESSDCEPDDPDFRRVHLSQ